MSNVFEELGLDAAVVESAEAQEVRGAFEAIPSEVYKATVKELSTFVTTNGATQMKAVIHIDSLDQDITVYQNIKKIGKDGKEGEPNPIGQATFKHILDACNAGAGDISVKAEEIEAYAKKVQGKVVKGLDGKVITAFVRAVHEDGAKYEDTNEIEAYGRADGTNSKGEDLIAAFREKIAKTPILNRKAKAGSGAAASKATSDATKDVNDML